jgi:hypothetical protein
LFIGGEEANARDEEFAMRRLMLALVSAGAAALAMIGDTLQVEARPLGGGWGAGRASFGRGAPRIGAVHRIHRIHRHGFRRGPLVRAAFGYRGARYLSEEAAFLSDNATYPTDSDAYPGFWSYGDPAWPSPAGPGYQPRTSYAVPVHRSPTARRIVTVYRGVPAPDGLIVRRVRYAR